MTAVTVWPKPDIAVTKRWQVYSTKCDFFCSSKSSSQTRLKTKETNAQKSPTDEEAYGPGFVQRLRRRFLTNTDHSQCIIQTAPLQCQRGKVQIDAIVAKPQLDRYETFTKAMPDNKRPQTTVNLSSVHKLKQKFESLSANESTCHHHIQHQPVSNKHCSKLFKDYCTPPPPTTTDNFSNNKKPISKKSEKMTTTTTTVSNAGYAEMTALLEKFRRNRELKEQQTSLHSKMDLRNEMNNKSEHANEMIDSNYQYPISPVGISLSKKWQHENGAVATPRTLAELRQVATVVASYVNMPTSTLNGNGRPCLLIESASECSSAESDDVSKNYEFDGAYVIPRKSSLCSGTRASKLKDTLVGFSEEPPVAYVYLEETEAENFGLWTAGADISMDLYFCIKEQMRKERENSQDISQLSERN
ncbi:hypothetical protein T4A_3630 [Trichinella pseudospiralis]|uniref:Uncharacterized protein n=1 Tax=Trichinella pseudospiralis TaxID=6337 RepID=A0A0V1EBK7_TRIPS|nr:hypothetical protein T4A_3630 [Trichinella pseudospiralis]